MSMQQDRRRPGSQPERDRSALPLALEMILEQDAGVGDSSCPALSLASQKRRLILAKGRQAARLEKHDPIAAHRELMERFRRGFAERPCLVKEALRDERSPTTAVRRESHGDSGGFENLGGRNSDLGMAIVGKRVVEDHNLM